MKSPLLIIIALISVTLSTPVKASDFPNNLDYQAAYCGSFNAQLIKTFDGTPKGLAETSNSDLNAMVTIMDEFKRINNYLHMRLDNSGWKNTEFSNTPLSSSMILAAQDFSVMVKDPSLTASDD